MHTMWIERTKVRLSLREWRTPLSVRKLYESSCDGSQQHGFKGK